MKTTIEISDPLLDEARKVAAREGTTLRAMVEYGLRRVLDDAKRAKPFKLRDGSVGGNGLQLEFRDADWAEIRRVSYGDRGG